jgi:uncharacterized protein (DUF885 family)
MSAPTPRPVDAVADRYVEDAAALDPVGATYLGVPGHDHELTDLSPDGFAARDRLARAALAAARAAEPTDDRERVAQDAFTERLGLQTELHDAGVPQSQVSVISSGLHEVRAVFDLMDTGDPHDEEAWSHVAARLAAVPGTLDGYRATLASSADQGRVSARRQLAGVAAQVRGWTGGDGFFRRLVAPAAVPSLAGDLDRGARAATEAFAAFGRWLEDDLVPQGRSRDAVGREEYALGSRYFLGAEVDLEEAYGWAWQELRRIEDEMARAADAVVPGGSVDDAVAALNADPTRRIAGTEPFRRWMQELADRTLAELAGTHFDIPEQIRRIECRIAPTHDGGIYYTAPSEDFARPGRMWWAVPDGIDSFATWREVTTVFHEGVPGHHLQIGHTVARHDLLNRWQRLMCWVSGHGEGWALYAERLMADLGHLDDPGDRLGMLDSQGFRSARVILDIGMHLELEIPRDNPFGFHPGETWTPDLGLEFLRAHSRDEDATLRFELERYLGWPGQAPSYKLGERIWLQARADAETRLGGAFDLRAFHRAALDLGPLGLDPLRTALGRLS